MSFKDNGEQSFLFDTEEPKLPDIPECNITSKLQHQFREIGFYISALPMDQYESIEELH